MTFFIYILLVLYIIMIRMGYTIFNRTISSYLKYFNSIILIIVIFLYGMLDDINAMCVWQKTNTLKIWRSNMHVFKVYSLNCLKYDENIKCLRIIGIWLSIKIIFLVNKKCINLLNKQIYIQTSPDDVH